MPTNVLLESEEPPIKKRRTLDVELTGNLKPHRKRKMPTNVVLESDEPPNKKRRTLDVELTGNLNLNRKRKMPTNVLLEADEPPIKKRRTLDVELTGNLNINRKRKMPTNVLLESDEPPIKKRRTLDVELTGNLNINVKPKMLTMEYITKNCCSMFSYGVKRSRLFDVVEASLSLIKYSAKKLYNLMKIDKKSQNNSPTHHESLSATNDCKATLKFPSSRVARLGRPNPYLQTSAGARLCTKNRIQKNSITI
eukprot:XP_016660860.1 PREDICTED: uncharacterized protein LOC107884031 [Acyrthosiphon pisum]